ncbi:MAG: DEAD/DEAH box helicase [Candidatus Paceibacterota bacterium]
MTEKDYKTARDVLLEDKWDLGILFAVSQTCSSLLMGKETVGFGRDLVIRVLDSWDKVPEAAQCVWNDLIEASGLYPYTKVEKLSGASLLRQEFHRSDFLKDKFLHSEQMELSNVLLHSDKSLIVSAPTSFGKSLLIEELVASKKYKNVVVIQPTLALLDETRKKLQKYSSDYTIVVSTTQKFSENERNLFLFTGERVVEYPKFPPIDFFIVDEFYKLSMDRDDERATSLNEAVYRLLKLTKKFYMLGPNIKNIPEDFSETYNAQWEKTNYATVAVDIVRLYEKVAQHDLYNYTHISLDKERVYKIEIENDLWNQLFTGSRETEIFFKSGVEKLIEALPVLKYKSVKIKLNNIYKDARVQGDLFNLLTTLNEPSLIYCSSPIKTFKVARRFIAFLEKRGVDDLKLPVSDKVIMEWIKENIDENWIMSKALDYSIGIHNGIIPRHLSSSIVDSFNNEKIRYLFCTSTLIEGVNTSAKNVVLLDRMKGPKPIDYFDFKNIAGRTGRMNRHFVGRVFQFHKEPTPMEIDVDIPLFTQKNATVELLVQIDPKDIKQVAEKKLEKFRQLDPKVQELIRRNKGVPIEGQLEILELLEKNIDTNYSLMHWKGFPKYNQLNYIIALGWTHLRQKGESNGGVRSPAQLATLTLQYCKHKSARVLIKMNYESEYWIKEIPNNDERLQETINMILQATQHWLNYKLPKLLVVMSELQKYVCEKKGLEPGDYTVLATTVENSFVPKYLAVLLEYGIPSSAINKIGLVIKEEMQINELVIRLKQLNLKTIGLLDYEAMKVQSLIDGYNQEL